MRLNELKSITTGALFILLLLSWRILSMRKYRTWTNWFHFIFLKFYHMSYCWFYLITSLLKRKHEPVKTWTLQPEGKREGDILQVPRSSVFLISIRAETFQIKSFAAAQRGIKTTTNWTCLRLTLNFKGNFIYIAAFSQKQFKVKNNIKQEKNNPRRFKSGWQIRKPWDPKRI